MGARLSELAIPRSHFRQNEARSELARDASFARGGGFKFHGKIRSEGDFPLSASSRPRRRSEGGRGSRMFSFGLPFG